MARPTFAEELCRSAIRRCEEQLGNGRILRGFGLGVLGYLRISVLEFWGFWCLKFGIQAVVRLVAWGFNFFWGVRPKVFNQGFVVRV